MRILGSSFFIFTGFTLLTVAALTGGCSAGGDDGTGGSTSSTGGRTGLDVDDDSSLGGSGGEKPLATIIQTLPEDFTVADANHPETSKGGYKVLGPLADVPDPEGECANILRAVIRDFSSAHFDFGSPEKKWDYYDVQTPIASTRKPALAETETIGPSFLEQWYTNVEDVNIPFAIDFWLEPVGDTFVFDSSEFFPINDLGYKDWYLFTTELHTQFEYKGGEVFTFRGDDDVLVFVNGRLAVNLSGIHNPQEGAVDLDEKATDLGIEVGEVYTFDLFQAERQPSGSNFRIETTLDFTGCGVVIPGVVN